MTTMTRSLTPDSRNEESPVTRVAAGPSFWIVAALFVAIAHQRMMRPRR